jgi:hypothetical protein
MMTWVELLLLLLLGVVGLLFLGGIVAAGILSFKSKPGKMPQFLAHAITTIGSVLATNLGAVLGLNLVEAPGLASTKGLYDLNQIPSLPQAPSTPELQVLAAWVYVIGLIVAFVMWAIKWFPTKPEEVVNTLPELSKTLLGVLVGALVVALGASGA